MMGEIEITTLPVKGLPDDAVDMVAKEISAQVALHIVTMYPGAATAVPWDSCKRSLSGVIRNNMARLGKAAERGALEVEIKKMKSERARISAIRKSTRFAFGCAT